MQFNQNNNINKKQNKFRKIKFIEWHASLVNQKNRKIAKHIQTSIRVFCPLKKMLINPDCYFEVVLSVYNYTYQIFDRHISGRLNTLYDKYIDYIMCNYDEHSTYIKNYQYFKLSKSVDNLLNIVSNKKIRGYLNPIAKIQQYKNNDFILFENDGMCLYNCINEYISITSNKLLKNILNNDLINISFSKFIKKLKKYKYDINIIILNKKERILKTNNYGNIKHNIIKIIFKNENDNACILLFDFKYIFHACLYYNKFKNISTKEINNLVKIMDHLQISYFVDKIYDQYCSKRKKIKIHE